MSPRSLRREGIGATGAPLRLRARGPMGPARGKGRDSREGDGRRFNMAVDMGGYPVATWSFGVKQRASRKTGLHERLAGRERTIAGGIAGEPTHSRSSADAPGGTGSMSVSSCLPIAWLPNREPCRIRNLRPKTSWLKSRSAIMLGSVVFYPPASDRGYRSPDGEA
jgi:hypothetical protein